MKRLAYALSAMMIVGTAYADDAAEKHWSGESELGYIWTNGNTKSETLLAKQKVVYDAKPWVNTFVAEANNTSNKQKNAVTNQNQKVRVAERYFVSDQVDYFVSERFYTFLRATGEKNRFNGFEFRASGVLGAGYSFLSTDTLSLKGEAGVGHAVDMIEATATTSKIRRSDAMGYVGEEFVWKFSPSAELGQSVRAEYTRFNTYSRFDAYIKSTLIGSLAMKAAYTLRFNNKVPAGTYKRDEEASVSLTYSF